MTKPSWDASELARSALSELNEGERVGLIVGVLANVTDASLIAMVRNEMTEHLSDLIAERYLNHMLGEDAA